MGNSLKRLFWTDKMIEWVLDSILDVPDDHPMVREWLECIALPDSSENLIALQEAIKDSRRRSPKSRLKILDAIKTQRRELSRTIAEEKTAKKFRTLLKNKRKRRVKRLNRARIHRLRR